MFKPAIKQFLTLKTLLPLLAFAIFLLGATIVVLVVSNRDKVDSLDKTISDLNTKVASLKQSVDNLTKENEALKGGDLKKQLDSYLEIVNKYETVKDKAASYKKKGVKVTAVEKGLAKIPDLIFGKKYNKADSYLTKLDKNLEKLFSSWQSAQAAAAAPPKTTNCSVPSSGHCRLSIKTSNGTFTVDVVAVNLNQTTIVTDTANSSDCSNNCPTKSLSSYVSGNNAFAGIHGTYFCPPDYASCAGQKNSYNFPVYNSNRSKWLNQGNLFWSGRAMMAFTSSNAVFYPQANSYSSLAGLKAAIVQHPGLVYNGKNIVNNYTLESAQLTKGYRGGIGVKGSTVYLVIAQSATVKDLAAIMVSIGATHALNLDGGGSSTLFYKEAPTKLAREDPYQTPLYSSRSSATKSL